MIRFRSTLFLFLMLVSSWYVSIAEASEPTADILILTSGGPQSPWVQTFINSLQNDLNQQAVRYNLFQEFIDCGNFNEETQYHLLGNVIQNKYSLHNIDVLLTLGPQAAVFLRNNSQLFEAGMKIGVRNTLSLDNLFEVSLMNSREYRKMASEVLRISRAEHIYLIGDTATEAQLLQYIQIESAFKGLSIPVYQIKDQSFSDLLDVVATVPEKSAVFCLPITRKDKSMTMLPREVIHRISQASNAPLFSDSTICLGHGIVGGYLPGPDLLGKSAADVICNRFFAIEPSQQFTPFTYLYDEAELKRWKLELPSPEIGNAVLIRQHKHKKADSGRRVLFSILLLTFCFLLVIYFQLKYRNPGNTKNEQTEETSQLPYEELTEREMQVLKHLYEGESLKAIAYSLKISDRTVSTYKRRILNKFSIQTDAELVKKIHESREQIQWK